MRDAGFRIDLIYPADDPRTALLSLDGRSVRLSAPDAPPAPSGLPAFAPEFVVTRAATAAGPGRAGMIYRDLVPGRLGGRYIASHIGLDAGPVADWVHYHRIALQLISVRRGWVRVVYEDQGEAFVMNEGDVVLQPPGIRHRVLESSAGLEVIEIGTPALHETFADHAMALPNGAPRSRMFGRQRFLHHVAATTPWTPFRGAEAQETAIYEASDGLVDVRAIRPGSASLIEFAPHHGELVFGFVLDGRARLDISGADLGPADSFVIPPGEAWGLSEMSSDLRLLHITTAPLDAAA